MPNERGEKPSYRRWGLPDRRARGSRSQVDPSAVAASLRAELPRDPEVLLVLGSGLAGVAAALSSPVEIPFGRLPGFPEAGVPGHPGRFVGGELGGRPVLAQVGRFHLYEGRSHEVVQTPTLAARALGARFAILTNSSGAIAPGLAPGDLALIADHLDLQGRPDGRGRAVRGALFDPGVADLALGAAQRLGIRLTPAVYAAVLGPNYETPAEIRALRSAGAGLVGMSTVPEARAAHRVGMRVLGLSLVSNLAAGRSAERLDHDAVLRAGARGVGVLTDLLPEVLRRLDP